MKWSETDFVYILFRYDLKLIYDSFFISRIDSKALFRILFVSLLLVPNSYVFSFETEFRACFCCVEWE